MRVEGHTTQSNSRQRHFIFSAEDVPLSKFDFTQPSTTFSHTLSTKRVRSTTDVDGEGSGDIHNKKRRLRLDLVTSRLSQPFATPTTNIVSRGPSKIAICARRRALGKNALRKAAILNSIKNKNPSLKRIENPYPLAHPRCFDTDEKWEGDKCTVKVGEVKGVEPAIARNSGVAASTSSPGFSDYDALDQDDGLYDEVDDSSDDCESVYSDFSIRDTTDTPSDEYDFLTSPDHMTGKLGPHRNHSREPSITDEEKEEQDQYELEEFEF
ncbi:hypothetical protein MMC14_009098 [Varicellaria rhodocarpa]|nr:hypothetical protein [Varicellaria rhodocarpa]